MIADVCGRAHPALGGHNDEAIMDNRPPYRISALPYPGKTKAYQEVREGRLRAVKCGRSTLILPQDYDRYLKSLPAIVLDKCEKAKTP
jgi:hypothetical protein